MILFSVPNAYQFRASKYFSERLFRGNAYQVRKLPAGSGTLIPRERLPDLEAAGWVRNAKLRNAKKKNGCSVFGALVPRFGEGAEQDSGSFTSVPEPSEGLCAEF